MMTTNSTCSPGNNPHADRRNFTLSDYLAMVEAGEAEWSLSEVSRITGWSRAFIYRAMTMASVSDDEFKAVMDAIVASGRRLTTSGVAAEIRRRTGQAKNYEEHCPHCGGVVRVRYR